MVQSKEELESWYAKEDPWEYKNNPQDTMRKARILSVIPQNTYENTLDIGSGNGFLTRDLPGKNIIGLEISEKAVEWARKTAPAHVSYRAGSLFDLPDLDLPQMDLVVITGVLYPQYLGQANRLAVLVVDQILKPGGILVMSHIYAWLKIRFPYYTISREYFAYREYSQVLEVYYK